MARSHTDRAYVIFSAQDYWYQNRGHSDLQLARGLARDRVVILVNSIGLRMPAPDGSTQPWKRIPSKLGSILHAVRRPEPDRPNLYVVSPVTLPFYGHRATRAFNAALVGSQIRTLLRALAIRRPDLIVTIPTAADIVRAIPHRSLTANRSDKLSAFEEANGEVIANYERQLLADCDLAVYVSTELMQEEEHLVGGHSFFLDHGVDLDLFQPAAPELLPSDIAALPRPIYGFFGALDDFVVDLDLLRRLADEIDEGCVVLIGKAGSPTHPLYSHPRVHWLGGRNHEDIPRYGSAFTVALMPWLQNPWIRYCNPIKVREYLALGLPVVTTSYPQAAHFESVMDVARSPEEFIRLAVHAAATGGKSSPEARRAAVSGDSWQHCTDRLATAIVELQATGRSDVAGSDIDR